MVQSLPHTGPVQLPARVPVPLIPKLRAYLHLLSNYAPGLVTGCYLTGSLALGAFDERQSDVDFVAVLTRRAASAELTALRQVHVIVEADYPAWRLDGCYLQVSDLGWPPPQIMPYPYCADGVFHPSGYHDINSVTWWLLKQHGITLLGPDPTALPFTVEWAQVAAYMKENVNTYWRAFTRPSSRLFWLLNDWGVQWAVLGVCRSLHSLQVGEITSKTEAGEAVLVQVPSRYHKIIREALALRRCERSRYRSHLRRAGDVMAFVRYVISACSRIAN